MYLKKRSFKTNCFKVSSPIPTWVQKCVRHSTCSPREELTVGVSGPNTEGGRGPEGREEWQGHPRGGPALSCSQVLLRPCRGGHGSMLLPPLTCSVPAAEWLAVPATLPPPRPAPALTPTNPYCDPSFVPCVHVC